MNAALAQSLGVNLRDHYYSQYGESDYAGYRLVNQTPRTEPNDRTAVLLLFDQRTRVIVVSTKRSRMCDGLSIRYRNRRIVFECAKRTADNSSNEHERFNDTARARGESREERGRGVTWREIPIAIIISRRESRSLTAVELPLRVEAQIARNEFLMIILFLFLLSPILPFFFSGRRNLSRYTLRARLSTSLARSSLIMNGLFIVVATHVRHFLRFHCVYPICTC